MIKVNSYEVLEEDETLAIIRCYLSNDRIIDFEAWKLFRWLESSDSGLLEYERKFDDWTSLVIDLEELGYDFIDKLNHYIGTFRPSEIADMMYTIKTKTEDE